MFEESEFEDEDTELVDQDEAVTDYEDGQKFENAFGGVAPDENTNFGFDERVEDEDLFNSSLTILLTVPNLTALNLTNCWQTLSDIFQFTHRCIPSLSLQ